MLQEFGEQIKACLERADQCKEAAATETDDHIRRQLLDLQEQWHQVAESYQRIESLQRLLLDHCSLPPEVDKLPKDFPPE